MIPQAWKDVVVRLQLSEVLVYRLLEDLDVEVESYFIDDYTTGDRPYEGHYLHYSTRIKKEFSPVTIKQAVVGNGKADKNQRQKNS